jgi:Ig domain of plant-specific actin-binding protein
VFHARPRLRVLVLAALALVVAAATAGIGGATTTATAPSNTAKPNVTGTAKQGNTLTSTSGSWAGDTPISFVYKWLSCDTAGNNCTTISGAGSSTYVLQGSDVGHRVRSQVTATNSAGSASQNSDPTATVVSAGAAPASTSLPAISGTARVGSKLTTTNGGWSGASPITYKYDWRRCDANGNSCTTIGLNSDNQTYVLVAADQGHAVRVVVTATNSVGQAQATSNPTAAVTAGGPANTALPAISGTATQGQTLTTTNGTWTSATTVTYTYQWERCDSAGNNCAAISGATSTTYVLAAADAGHKLRATVKATNSTGSNSASSATVGPVATGPTLPPGAVKLPNGEISVPASSVSDTNRLTIVSVKYSPSAIHGKAPITLTVKVTDVNKYVISGVLVYVLPVPSNWAAKTPEVPTGQDGTARIRIQPTLKTPKRGSLVLFVRARTPQGNLLAGSSSRRPISVRIFAR